jgi:hypothetical protein
MMYEMIFYKFIIMLEFILSKFRVLTVTVLLPHIKSREKK